MTGWVLHVDLDQFVAAVEVLRRPELRGRPVVVGGDGDPGKRGVVSTASYEARAFGVHSGQPLRVAARKCPDAVFLPVDAPAYETASALVMAALRDSGAVVEVLGWDEAFLALDTVDPEAAARDLQRRVREATSLDSSVGIGDNRLRAKLATGFGKPAGVFRLTQANWDEVMGERPTDALWGVGAKTAKRLAVLGLRIVAELAAADPQVLAAAFGPATGPWLVRLAHGEDDTPVTGAPYVARSLSKETTFQTDLADWADVRREVLVLAARVADTVAEQERPVGRVVVKIRYVPFTTRTHGHTLDVPTTDPAAIERAALAALDAFPTDREVRLLGVRAEFTPPP
ncbi:DNA polymerase IV [Catellatospora methionotrophica]|uniref:DNA polymerase IV n=1 Tax=Catellatospora methionotrophica TaxID=121620 RepID=UPI0019448518|nr:DNA polymerase IV [Catellatospora methionotrophica]